MFCFPLLCFFLSSFISGTPISRFIGHRGSIVISIILSGLGMLSSILIEYEVIYGSCEAQMNYFGTWISLGSFDISWSSYTDLYSAHMLLTVSVVSFAVHCYAVVYMKNDPHLSLFMCYLSAFTFSMLILVSGSNMLIMMLGWELIGVCSYLLIGYWSHRLAASKSAQKAIVVNRISDGLLLWSILWLWWYTGTLEYDLILLNDSNNISSILSISLLLGCMAKFNLAQMRIIGNFYKSSDTLQLSAEPVGRLCRPAEAPAPWQGRGNHGQASHASVPDSRVLARLRTRVQLRAFAYVIGKGSREDVRLALLNIGLGLPLARLYVSAETRRRRLVLFFLINIRLGWKIRYFVVTNFYVFIQIVELPLFLRLVVNKLYKIMS